MQQNCNKYPDKILLPVEGGSVPKVRKKEACAGLQIHALICVQDHAPSTTMILSARMGPGTVQVSLLEVIQ